MPSARVQTGHTNRPASARAESVRNSALERVSRPASAKPRRDSERSINSSARRGRIRPGDSGAVRSERSAGRGAVERSGYSARVRHGNAWNKSSTEEVREGTTMVGINNKPNTREATKAVISPSQSARKDHMFRTASDGKMPLSTRANPKPVTPMDSTEDHNWATVALVSESAKNTNKNSSNDGNPGYMAAKKKSRQREQRRDGANGPKATDASEDSAKQDDRKDFLKGIVVNRDLGDLLTMVQADKKKNKSKQRKKIDPSDTRYRRPEASRKIPLRSMFLDPAVCSFQPSTTRKSLMRKIREINLPHQSYDIDGDGIVSQGDLFCAKRFDVNNDGVLDENEVNVGRLVIAEDFFKNHKDKARHYFGPEYTDLSIEESVGAICKNYSLDGIVRKLQSVEQDIGLTSSQQMRHLLHYQTKADLARPDPTSFSASVKATDTHNGSRAALFAVRRAQDRSRCQRLLNKSYETSMYGTLGGTTGSSDVTRPSDPKTLPLRETPETERIGLVASVAL